MERSQICVKYLQYTLWTDTHLVLSHRVVMERPPVYGKHLQSTLWKDTHLVSSI